MVETKVCKDCGVEKPLDEFSRCGKKGRGIRARCRLCYNARERIKSAEKRALRPPKKVPTTRTCKQCGAVRPLAEFPFRRRRGIDYRSYLCRDCYAAKRRADRIAKSGWIPPHKTFTDPVTGIEMKRCRHCEIDKPLTAYGWRQGKRVAICKTCAAEKRKADYDAAPEKYRKAAQDYAKRNPEKVRARDRRRRAENRDRLIIEYRKYNDQHRAERQAYDQHRRNVPGYYRDQYQKYRSVYLAAAKRRRARKLKAPIVDSIDQAAIVERDNSTCYLCNCLLTPDEITLDHVIPLARGGSHTADNLRVACRPCNSRKHAKLLEELDWV